jgi:hypothetical protein
VTDAIPLFNEVVLPFSKLLTLTESANNGSTSTSSSSTSTGSGSGSSMPSSNGISIKKFLKDARTFLDNSADIYASSPFSPVFVEKELLPIFRQGLEIVDQIPPLLESIASGLSFHFHCTPIYIMIVKL